MQKWRRGSRRRLKEINATVDSAHFTCAMRKRRGKGVEGVRKNRTGPTHKFIQEFAQLQRQRRRQRRKQRQVLYLFLVEVGAYCENSLMDISLYIPHTQRRREEKLHENSR